MPLGIGRVLRACGLSFHALVPPGASPFSPTQQFDRQRLLQTQSAVNCCNIFGVYNDRSE